MIPQQLHLYSLYSGSTGNSFLLSLPEGAVLIDGRDARDRSQLWLHDAIGYVLQTPHLFSGTVRENLLMVIYAFSRLPRDHRQLGLQIHVATQWLGLTVASIYPVFLAMVLICAPGDFLRYIYASLTFGSVGALIPAFIYARRVSPLDSVWAVMFTGYTILALFWIPLYSLLTVRNSSWLTRELPRKRGGIAKLPTESAH